MPVVAFVVTVLWLLVRAWAEILARQQGEMGIWVTYSDGIAWWVTLAMGLGWLGAVSWVVPITIMGGNRDQWWWWLGMSWCSFLCSGHLAQYVSDETHRWMNGGGLPDLYAVGIEVPPGREWVMPRGLAGPAGIAEPEPVRRLRSLRQALPGTEPLAELPPTPNLEELTRRYPSFLQEYLMRSLYAEAISPRFNSPVLAWMDSVFLLHPDDPQSRLACVRTHGESDWYYEKLRQLHNGWCIVQGTPGNKGKAEMNARVMRLERQLEPLARNPSREILDALLPPLPDMPFLCLWQRGRRCGFYRACVILPPSFSQGWIVLRAREVTTGKAIVTSSFLLPIEPCGSFCSLAMDADLEILSGNEGEFYAADWAIFYLPTFWSELQLVGRQQFVVQGNRL